MFDQIQSIPWADTGSDKSLERLPVPQSWAAGHNQNAVPVPRISKELRALASAWEDQADNFGRISRETLQRIDQIASGRTQTRHKQPGMRLVRGWSGKTHVVVIDDDGIIHWNQQKWRSLSEVARAITGTRWSGPAFFGLKMRLPK